MLINGEAELSREARVGEVVRLHLVNTANTRLFNIGLRGARMKRVGGDSGRYEKEEFVDHVLLSPSERAIVDVLFDVPGEVRLEHRAPDQTYDLGAFSVEGAAAANDRAAPFDELRVDPELTAVRQSLQDVLMREPDKVLSFVSEMPILYGGDDSRASSYVCPMHPEVTSTEQDDCPKCGMKLIPADDAPDPGEGAHAGHEHGDHGDGLEWEDLMPEINRKTNTSNMIWRLVDRDSGAENEEISWSLSVGDRVKIRLVNGMDQEHPMHHPFHVHGAGRFLVLSTSPIQGGGWRTVTSPSTPRAE
jgi:FtsP/CotA-like multicopper oxidase with cupredoxin domain